MSARSPITLPEAVLRPLMTPTTPVLPMPGTISSQPNAASFSATTPAVRCRSKPISGCSCKSWRHSATSSCMAAMRLMTGMLLSLVGRVVRILARDVACRHPTRADAMGAPGLAAREGMAVCESKRLVLAAGLVLIIRGFRKELHRVRRHIEDNRAAQRHEPSARNLDDPCPKAEFDVPFPCAWPEAGRFRQKPDRRRCRRRYRQRHRPAVRSAPSPVRPLPGRVCLALARRRAVPRQSWSGM